jgi:hypothetical protein
MDYAADQDPILHDAVDAGPVTYTPRNRLKDKVTLNGKITGGGLYADLLARAEANVTALTGRLQQEAVLDIARLEDVRDKLDRHPSRRNEQYFKLEKIAHDITGYGSTIGFDLLTRYGRSLSLFLRKTEIGGTIKLQVARAHIDSMILVYRTPIKGQGGKNGEALTAMLNLTIAKFVPEP